MNTRVIFIFILLISVITSCAYHKTQDMLDSRLGKMNYEEALQRFGPPTKCAEAGSTQVCTWVYGSGGMVYAPIGNMMVAMPTDAPTAQLTFNRDVLTAWRLTGNWE